MKSITRILLVALALVPCVSYGAAPLSGTLGSNLTAYNPNGGAVNNNEWNSMMNSRSGGNGGAPAAADFGNCNSVVMRCASPKCANGGCASMDVAMAIVSGCVASNAACKQYGNDLVQYISAQLVANSNAAAAQQQQAAADMAAQQSAMQMQQMQQQMQQMQQQMAAQNEAQLSQLQNALEEQKQLTQQAMAEAAAAQTAAQNAAQAPAATSGASDAGGTGAAGSGSSPTTVMEGLTEAQRIAASAGVPADVLAREQVAGQIMTSIENAQQNLKTARAAMLDAFEYAGCTTKGDSCTGPKRVAMFRNKAQAFFEPYDAVLDDLYDALITAQSVGIDITDIYMMLNGSCNVWGEYLCYGGEITTYRRKPTGWDEKGKVTGWKDDGAEPISTWVTYLGEDTYYDGIKVPKNCGLDGKSIPTQYTKGGVPCTVGMVVPPEDSPSCTLNRTITDSSEVVQRNWLFADNGDRDEHVRVGCASSALESSKFFRNRKKGSSIDIEVLQRILAQDAPNSFGSNAFGKSTEPDPDGVKYCAVTPDGYQELQKAASLKKLPARICVTDNVLKYTRETKGGVSIGEIESYIADTSTSNDGETAKYSTKDECVQHKGIWIGDKCRCLVWDDKGDCKVK